MRGLAKRLRGSRSAAFWPSAPAIAADDAPAGIDPSAPAAPGFRDRGRLRRRLRHLRRLRELGFRDLGGLVFDLHRFGRRGDELVAQKLNTLAALDQELRALERALDDERPFHELREPGLTACVRCAAIHGSDARFCPSCGTSLRGPLAVGGIGSVVPAAAAAVSAPASTTPVAQAGSTPVASTLAAESQPTEAIPVTTTGAAGSDPPPAAPDGTEVAPGPTDSSK